MQKNGVIESSHNNYQKISYTKAEKILEKEIN